MTKTSSTFEKTAQSPKAWWEDVQLACVFLTRLPWRIEEVRPPEALNRALRCFPLIGLLVGGLSAAVFIVASYLGLPTTVCAILCVAASILITGALHEDGLADVADGFGGGYGKERKLEIMRDSRVGTYGVLALVIGVALRVSALSSFYDIMLGASVIISVAILSRLAPVIILYSLAPARTDGLAGQMARPEKIIVIQACALGLGLFLLCVHPVPGLITLTVCALTLWMYARLARRQIGGQTGDVCGAAQQLCEITALLCLVGLT